MSKRRRPWILYVGGPILAAFLALQVFDQRPILAQDAAAKAHPKGLAVVELFTSEGCSSCPPADELLREVSQQAEANGQQVLTLAFHVDYWDKLGWRDPYADPAYTLRQKRYARSMKLRSLYTPQMIVNGKAQFVGSSRRKARAAVGAALSAPAAAQVSLTLHPDDGKTLRVAYAVSNQPAGARLQLALVERGLRTKVLRGENGGRTLKHHDVVRAFRSQPLNTGAGEVLLPIPSGLVRGQARVVAYVQVGRSGAIVGGAASKLAP